MKVNILKLNEPGYPKILRTIPDSPKQIFYLGANPELWLDKPKVAIVGSRKVTAYGREVTNKLATELTRAGVVIISGLALGADGQGHKACLDQGGITVAVLPTSLDQIYPTSHNNLARQIVASGGTLISEYPAGSIAYKVNFTARNRIVSGLADIVLITEAAARSGTLNTARYALDQGKTVMAVPGNITNPNSQGTNNLIKSGGIAVTETSDILFALKINPVTANANRAFMGSDDEGRILSLIKKGTRSQDELALKSKLDAQTINSILTMLEIDGYIKPTGGGNWSAV